MIRLFRNPLTLLDTIGNRLTNMPVEKKKIIGRMFSVQDSLPKLPVPPLDQTLQKYLRTIRPLVSDGEFKYTQKVVEQFRKDPGPNLQNFLEQRASQMTNWLSDWWKHVAYLDLRIPVVINSNPAIVFPKQNFTTEDGQLKFAAKYIAGGIDYQIMIDEERVPIEKLGGKPLCMTQYYQFLSACRIPGVKKDSHVCYPPTSPNPPRHIVVVHNNHFFRMEVFGKDGKPLNTEQICEQLQKIVDQSRQPGPPLGILTFKERTGWAKNYNTIVKDKSNKANMEDIQRAIFIMCLDKAGPTPASEDEGKNLAAYEVLHGGGSSLNSGNRWFDKTMQFVVGKNGVAGLNYEHTTAEGPPIAALMDHILTFCEKDESGPPASGVKEPKKLNFNLSDDILHDIDEAKVQADMMAKDVDITVFTFDKYGKNFPKSQKLSPDGFIQVALQLAYFRLHGRPCATYETASLRRFQHGRTDTIRSCSIDSLNFTKAMTDNSVSKETKVDLFRKAIMAHRKYTDEAINGNGIDRHLLGLKLAAVEAGMNVPDLHMDTSYSAGLHFRLSTSQVQTEHEIIMGFGAVVHDGYGLYYNPNDSRIIFSVTHYLSCPNTDSKKLATNIEESLNDLHELCLSTEITWN